MTDQLFSQSGSEKPSVCIKPYCPLSHTPVAVAYNNFLNLPRSGLIQCYLGRPSLRDDKALRGPHKNLKSDLIEA